MITQGPALGTDGISAHVADPVVAGRLGALASSAARRRWPAIARGSRDHACRVGVGEVRTGSAGGGARYCGLASRRPGWAALPAAGGVAGLGLLPAGYQQSDGRWGLAQPPGRSASRLPRRPRVADL